MISKGRARNLARRSAEDAAKIIAIQEKQIAQLQGDLLQLTNELTFLKNFRLVYDVVDSQTGEVSEAIWQEKPG